MYTEHISIEYKKCNLNVYTQENKRNQQQKIKLYIYINVSWH